MSKWHKGPPPSVGWWPASMYRFSNVYRWWNGKQWSRDCHQGMSAKAAAKTARKPSQGISEIEWSDRPASWPKRSRT